MIQHEIHWMQPLGNLSFPHFVKRDNESATIIIKSDYEINEGDEIASLDTKLVGLKLIPKYSGIITRIVERRPAKGDWKSDRPHFIHIEYRNYPVIVAERDADLNTTIINK